MAPTDETDAALARDSVTRLDGLRYALEKRVEIAPETVVELRMTSNVALRYAADLRALLARVERVERERDEIAEGLAAILGVEPNYDDPTFTLTSVRHLVDELRAALDAARGEARDGQ